MFSCANLIFVFTMNLPDGMDEAVRKTLGFVQAESNLSVVTKVENEIKTILSTAFLSRVGVPILFAPLSAETLSIIAERAVKSAILMAAKNLKFPVIDVDVESGLGTRLISSLSGNVTTYGARRILEHGRYLAARAVIDFSDSKPLHSNGRLRVRFNSDNQMVLSVNQQPLQEV
jgi:ATP-dependent Clp protease ATP-binding subunit ClpA